MSELLHLPWLDESDGPERFPHPDHALDEPDGLLALGGDLEPERLLGAYRRGIFPWYAQGQPILWWSPAERGLFLPDDLHVSRSLRRRLRQTGMRLTLDQAFEAVVRGCAAPRADQEGTWITREMVQAYSRLHELGYSHSIEVWRGEALVGGLYGLAIGAAFFGESMFSRERDASKIALAGLMAQLRRWGFHFLDAQMSNPHLARMGLSETPRSEYLTRLAHALPASPAVAPAGRWTLDSDLQPVGIAAALAEIATPAGIPHGVVE